MGSRDDQQVMAADEGKSVYLKKGIKTKEVPMSAQPTTGKVSQTNVESFRDKLMARSDPGKDISPHNVVTGQGENKGKNISLQLEGKQKVGEAVKGARSAAKGEGTTIRILQREKAKEAEEMKKLMYAKELAMRRKFENLFIKMNGKKIIIKEKIFEKFD
jgi:hypothetical protein